MKSLVEYLAESLNTDKNIQNINEDVYEGCEELSKFLVEKIHENIDKEFFSFEKSELKFPNVFFETLYVFINPKEDSKRPTRKPKEFKKVRGRKISESVGASYEIADTDKKNLIANIIKWNNETKTFNYLILKIFIDDEDVHKVIIDPKMIGHELNHAYEDYKIRLESNGEKTLNDYIYSYYDNARKLANSSVFHEKVIGYIEYLTTGTEMRAFCKQALMHFKENIHKYENLDDAIRKQGQDNDIFGGFYNRWCQFETCLRNKSEKQKIIDAYKKIHKDDTDYNNESDDKIIKRIRGRLYKFEDALIKEIKKYYKKYHEEN